MPHSGILHMVMDLFQPSGYSRKHRYRFGKVIGEGTYGIVREAFTTDSNQTLAVKIIHKKHIPRNSLAPHREVFALAKVDHPNVMRFIEFFESRSKYYIVCEMATGGELFDRIVQRGCFTELDASKLVFSVASAIAEIHRNNIVHRDLKPENLLFRSPDNLQDLFIADFGVSREIVNDEYLFTVCGSPGYCAPEVLLSKGHGKACDMWSIGVITFTILCGYSPFGPIDMPQQMMRRMFSAPVTFDNNYWKHISEEAKDFVRCLLVLDPVKRLSAQEALEHPWLRKFQNVQGTTAEAAAIVNLLSDQVRAEFTKVRDARVYSDLAQWMRVWREHTDGGVHEHAPNEFPSVSNVFENNTVAVDCRDWIRGVLSHANEVDVILNNQKGPVEPLDIRVEAAIERLLGGSSSSTSGTTRKRSLHDFFDNINSPPGPNSFPNNYNAAPDLFSGSGMAQSSNFPKFFSGDDAQNASYPSGYIPKPAISECSCCSGCAAESNLQAHRVDCNCSCKSESIHGSLHSLSAEDSKSSKSAGNQSDSPCSAREVKSLDRIIFGDEYVDMCQRMKQEAQQKSESAVAALPLIPQGNGCHKTIVEDNVSISNDSAINSAHGSPPQASKGQEEHLSPAAVVFVPPNAENEEFR